MDQPQATTVKLHLGLTLGVSYIGIVFSSMLYGLTCLQTFIYFVSAPRDPWLVKAFVVLTLIIDSTHEAFIVHSGYYYSVLNFNNPAVFDHVVWSLLAFIFLNALSGLLTEGFILWRIYHMSGPNVYLCTVLVGCYDPWSYWLQLWHVLTIVVLGDILMPLCFAAYPIQGLRDPRFDQVQKLTGTAVPALVLAAIADIALAASLAYYLHKARTGIKPSDTIVKKLILYAVTTGLVPGINRLLDLIVYLALPEDFFYQAFNFPICKLYTNTLLATLNARASVRSLGHGVAFESVSLVTAGIDRESPWRPSRTMRRGATETGATSLAHMENSVRLVGSEVDLKVPPGVLHA